MAQEASIVLIKTGSDNTDEDLRQVDREVVNAHHYTMLREAFTDEAKSELIPEQKLLAGPAELVAVLNSNKDLRREALSKPIFIKENMKELFDKYGRSLEPNKPAEDAGRRQCGPPAESSGQIRMQSNTGVLI